MLGLPGNAIDHARKVKRLSPPDLYLYVFHTQEGLAHIMLGEDDLAVACLRQAVANNPEFPAASGYLVAALALTGKDAEAREQLARYLSLPDACIKTVAAGEAWSTRNIRPIWHCASASTMACKGPEWPYDKRSSQCTLGRVLRLEYMGGLLAGRRVTQLRVQSVEIEKGRRHLSGGLCA
ncbi:hypothetical protein [Bradyrhizobium liaoningense]|uniref:hypothetical protein n=1 Tax=Bradyrhizobium liaoningense TaxID=43992 RepID=UPI001BA9BA7E|nr:hypothetical protein [Bradyrhizobium liaoningense]MBR0719882.1 hypothetical protein [Bradyrhizobium liaoningense]